LNCCFPASIILKKLLTEGKERTEKRFFYVEQHADAAEQKYIVPPSEAGRKRLQGFGVHAS